MICKLCLEDRKLIKAHIIPDFMFKSIYDEEHKLIRTSISNPNSAKRIPTGEYDPNILCADCDNRLSVYENYASKVFYYANNLKGEKPEFIELVNQHGIRFTKVQNINYKLFKLFLLSILWRASVTNRPTFSDVKLPAEKEESLRQMIYSENPGEVHDFPCVVMTFLRTNMEHGFVGAPRRFVGNKRVVFIIAGFMYTFYISEDDKPIGELEVCINDKNEMGVVHIPEFKARQIINSFFGEEVF